MPVLNASNNTADLQTNASTNAFGKPYDLNTSGNNPFGTIFRHIGIGTAPSAYSRAGFYSELEPVRQNNIRDLIAQLSAGNRANYTQSVQNQYAQQGAQQGNVNAAQVAGGGGSDLAQLGAKLAAMNAGTQAGNQFANQVNSPLGKLQALQAQLQALGLGQDLGLDQLMQLYQAIEQRNAANAQAHQNQGVGGALGGILGQALGGISFGGGSGSLANLLTGGGGSQTSGGGNFPPIAIP